MRDEDTTYLFSLKDLFNVYVQPHAHKNPWKPEEGVGSLDLELQTVRSHSMSL